MSILDLSIIIKNIITAKDKWEKTHYLRHGTLLIFETIKTYHTYSKKVNQTINTSFPEMKDQIRELSLNIRDFKKEFKYDSKMAYLRNNAVGHINEDFWEYCKTISNIDPNKVKACLFEYLEILKKMHNIQDQISELFIINLLSKTGKKLEYYLENEDDLFERIDKDLPKLVK